ncbi:MAG: hypothetical protein EPN94_06345 [Nitrospirae bacterium]|nr:MAG: hypothetical protein EPN94_06345 [Nitrospirota bacterium]
MLKKVQKANKFQEVRVVAIATILAIATFATSIVFAGITGTKHDLSTSGPGTIKAAAGGVTQKCVFCHTPHSSSKEGPLWNHSLSSATYVVYTSLTMLTIPSQPDFGSKLCLGCHDGTVALGLLVNTPGSEANPVAMTQTYMPAGATGYMGTDLTNKHPVSIVINGPFITAKQAQCAPPPAGLGTTGVQYPAASSPVKLYKTGNTYGGEGGNGVQCRSCHDPHDDVGSWRCFLVHVPGINCTTCPCAPALNPLAPLGSNPDALCAECHYTCL